MEFDAALAKVSNQVLTFVIKSCKIEKATFISALIENWLLGVYYSSESQLNAQLAKEATK